MIAKSHFFFQKTNLPPPYPIFGKIHPPSEKGDYINDNFCKYWWSDLGNFHRIYHIKMETTVLLIKFRLGFYLTINVTSLDFNINTV